MLISASRRTDIPAYYSEWFFRRIDAGYVYVRNPMNPHQISQVSLSPDVVDGIVFWTKNPAPMLGQLDRLRDYPFYFQCTLNPYGRDIEPHVPSKNDIVIPAFQRLAAETSREQVLWRYDPILLSDRYTMAYHATYFQLMADRLADYTDTCTVSFLDLYQSIRSRIAPLGITAPSPSQVRDLMGRFREIAREHGLSLNTCAEEIDLSSLGIGHARCVDPERLGRIGSCKLDIPADKNQRAACGCAASVDIGAYHSCQHGCLYCYANWNSTLVRASCAKHDPCSPLLWGQVTPEDVIKQRAMVSCKVAQLDLFR